MTRTFNLQLLRGKWVFPVSKPDTNAKLKLRNSLLEFSTVITVQAVYLLLVHVHMLRT